MLTSSGQAANFYAIMNIVEAGDHIVCASALYGGTYNLYAHTIKKMGVDATFVDPDCTEEELNAAFQENTKAVFGETIANPALSCAGSGEIRESGPCTRRTVYRGQYICNSNQLPPV